MEISSFLTTIGISSIITLIFTKLWDLWREKVKIKNEDRKLLRKALTSLTNLWQSLLTWDFENQLDISSDMLFKQFELLGAKSEQLEALKIQEIDKSKIVTLQVQTAIEKWKLLDEQIDAVVEKLSEIRPLIASELHELQSNTPIRSFEKTLKEQLNDGKERPPYQFDMISNVQNQFFQKFKDRLTERIKPYILLIAEQIDTQTLEETEKHLEMREKERLEFLERKRPDVEMDAAKLMVEALFTAHLKSSKENSANTHNQQKDIPEDTSI